MEVGGTFCRVVAEACRGGEAIRVDVAIGGTAGDVVVPRAAARIVEQDALETMIGADRPATVLRQRRERRAGEMEPVGFERGAEFHILSGAGRADCGVVS